MKRHYENKELKALRDEQVVDTIYGTEVIVRKIPFETKKGIMDPHLYEYKYKSKNIGNGNVPPAFPVEWFNLPVDELLMKLQNKMRENLEKKEADAKPDEEFDVSCKNETFHFPKRSVNCYCYEANNKIKENRPCVIMIHGGGWSFGKPIKYDLINCYIANHANAIVFDVDYALAPQHRYPEGFNDCENVLKYIYENAEKFGVDKNKIVVCGGSAGGNLTAALALKCRDENKPYIAMQILLVPCLLLGDEVEVEGYNPTSSDYVIDDETKKLVGELQPMEKTPSLKIMARGYVGKEGNLYEPYISPLTATNFKKLPKALVMAASLDMLWPQAISYVKKLRDAGCEVKAIKYEGIEHESNADFGIIPQSEDLCKEIVDAILSL